MSRHGRIRGVGPRREDIRPVFLSLAMLGAASVTAVSAQEPARAPAPAPAAAPPTQAAPNFLHVVPNPTPGVPIPNPGVPFGPNGPANAPGVSEVVTPEGAGPEGPPAL